VTALDKRDGRPGCELLDSLTKVPYDRPPYTRYPHLADLLKEDPLGAPLHCEVARNISFGGKWLTGQRSVKPEWVRVADNWDEGDPGFMDVQKADFRLKPGAPALKIGFEPLPLDKIGLVNAARVLPGRSTGAAAGRLEAALDGSARPR